MVELVRSESGSQARLVALCVHCEMTVTKFVSLKDRLAFEVDLGESIDGDWED